MARQKADETANKNNTLESLRTADKKKVRAMGQALTESLRVSRAMKTKHNTDIELAKEQQNRVVLEMEAKTKASFIFLFFFIWSLISFL